MKSSSAGAGVQPGTAPSSAGEGENKSINGVLWQACAGPLVNLPASGTHVVYFPQGHSEQVAASMKKDVDARIPNYPNLQSKLLCLLRNVTLHADPETDEVYAQITLQPVSLFDKDSLLRSDLSMKSNKSQPEFFCKTLTASDTSTHGGFSVPRRSAEKIFPPLDYTMQPPAQEIVARDLHDNVWTFRHIYRGQPKRHLLTTGWSLFVSGKKLLAGDSVLFIRDEKQQLLLGIRRANRQPTNLSSSVLSSDSMHIGILAAAAHATANNSTFTVFYNPRASPLEFVIPLAKYYKAVCSNQISLGMRFRMMFETEDSGTRRYMGTITGISDIDPVRWKNSQWRNIQVGWDEATVGESRDRVSIWEIEPVTAPFFVCPSPTFFRSKRPRQPGMPDDDVSDLDSIFRRAMPWLGEDFGLKDPQPLHCFSLFQWMNMHQNSMQPNYNNPLPNSNPNNVSPQLSLPGGQLSQQNNIQFNAAQRLTPPAQQLDQLHKLPASTLNPVGLGSMMQPQQQLSDFSQTPRSNFVSQALSTSQVQPQILESMNPMTAPNVLQPQQSLLNHLPAQQQQIMNQTTQQNLMPFNPLDQVAQQLHMSDNQIQLQLLQKLHQQQPALLAQQSVMQQTSQLQDQPKHLLDVPPNFSKCMTTSQMMDSSLIAQLMTRNNSMINLPFSQPPQQSNVHQQPQQQQSAVTDEVPSCSTSPSTNNCANAVQYAVNGRSYQPTIIGDEIIQPSAALVNSNGLAMISSTGGNLMKDLQKKSDVKLSSNVLKSQNLAYFASQSSYINPTGMQMDLDSSSSATSILSQNDAQVPQNNSFSVNSPYMFFRDASQDFDFHGDVRNSVSFGANIDNQLGMTMMDESLITKNVVNLGKDITADLSSGGGVLSGYENAKEAQPELSSSVISQSFGVPDMAFNSIDSTVNGSSIMNRGAWAQPHMSRMRTFTKVYKRGAVGRSIDITRYSGYDELKHDLARRFGIEGQLENGQRIGWKLVYVDLENDVLLVGDDPWEEFVNCVRCIKILSPQEVQQMSLDGDIESSMLPNQACSSSDNVVH